MRAFAASTPDDRDVFHRSIGMSSVGSEDGLRAAHIVAANSRLSRHVSNA